MEITKQSLSMTAAFNKSPAYARRGLAKLLSEQHEYDPRPVESVLPTVTPDLILTLAVRQNYPCLTDKETEAQVMNVTGQNGTGRERQS